MDVELLLRVAGRFDRCINELVRLQTERAALLAVLAKTVFFMRAMGRGGISLPSPAFEWFRELCEAANAVDNATVHEALEKARALVGERSEGSE